jgi:hypothetical protein
MQQTTACELTQYNTIRSDPIQSARLYPLVPTRSSVLCPPSGPLVCQRRGWRTHRIRIYLRPGRRERDIEPGQQAQPLPQSQSQSQSQSQELQQEPRQNTPTTLTLRLLLAHPLIIHRIVPPHHAASPRRPAPQAEHPNRRGLDGLGLGCGGRRGAGPGEVGSR